MTTGIMIGIAATLAAGYGLYRLALYVGEVLDERPPTFE